MNIIKTSIAALAVLVSAVAVSAQENSYALPFVAFDRDPVTSAMGNAGLASSEYTAWSAFRNSAVIPFSSKTLDIQAAFQNWAPKGAKTTNVDFGAGWKISENFGLALGFAYDMGAEYELFGSTGSSKGTFKPTDVVVNLGAGFKFTDKLGAGVNVRYASEKLAESSSYTAFGGDVFLMFKTGDIGVTAGVSNLGSSVKSGKNTWSIPAAGNVAVNYSKSFAEKHAVDLNVDGQYYLKGGLGVAFGGQYAFNDMVFIRAGYHYGSADAVLPSYATLGAGVKFAGVRLDLAYLAGDVLGNTIAIGIGYSF